MDTRKKLLVLVALVLAACEAEDATSGITIRGRSAGSEACEFDPGDRYLLGPGVLDVGPQYQALAAQGALQFGMVLMLRNDLVDPTQLSSATTSSGKTWWARNVRVETSTAVAGASGVRRYAVPSHAIEPGGGEGVQDVVVIDPELSGRLVAGIPPGASQLVVLKIKIEGVTGDGFDLDSNEWSFPLQVCNGCLPVPVCAPGEVLVFNSCFFPGQDGAAACVAAAAP